MYYTKTKRFESLSLSLSVHSARVPQTVRTKARNYIDLNFNLCNTVN